MEKLKALIEGLELDKSVFTEEVIDKMTVVIESALVESKAGIESELKEEYEGKIVEYKEYLETQLDNYLNEFVEEFIGNNKDQINESVRVQTADKIVETFDAIVKEFNIKTSDVSVSESIESDTLKAELNAAVNENIELKAKMQEEKVATLVSESAKVISVDSSREKFISLAEGLSFDGEDSFKQKLATLQESLTESQTEVLTESEVEESSAQLIEESTNVSSVQKEILTYLQ